MGLIDEDADLRAQLLALSPGALDELRRVLDGPGGLPAGGAEGTCGPADLR
jgi:hypothetical protein